MQRLVDKIVNDLPKKKNFHIEVNVIDGVGEQYEVYMGSVKDFNTSHLYDVLREPACFYNFSVIGMDESLLNAVDEFHQSMIRREFSWLTDPIPPLLISKSPTSIQLSWDPVKYIGSEQHLLNIDLQYHLQIAEGQEFRDGVTSKFVTDLFAINFIDVCSGPNIFSAEINDLKSAHWYHVRLMITCRGTTVISESLSVPTPRTVPAAPNKPRLYIEDSKRYSYDTPQLLFRWNSPFASGLQVEKYQLQIQQIDSAGIALPGDQFKSKSLNFNPTTSNNNNNNNSNNKNNSNSLRSLQDGSDFAFGATVSLSQTHPLPSSPLLPPQQDQKSRNNRKNPSPTPNNSNNNNNNNNSNNKSKQSISHNHNTHSKDKEKDEEGKSIPKKASSARQLRDKVKSSSLSSPSDLDPLNSSLQTQHLSDDFGIGGGGGGGGGGKGRGGGGGGGGDSSPPNPSSFLNNMSKWKTVYLNADNKAVVDSPPLGVVEWMVRVRAKNSIGWSEYSPVLTLNSRTHPSLFIAGLSTLRPNRIPPLSSSPPSGSPLLSSTSSSSSPPHSFGNGVGSVQEAWVTQGLKVPPPPHHLPRHSSPSQGGDANENQTTQFNRPLSTSSSVPILLSEITPRSAATKLANSYLATKSSTTHGGGGIGIGVGVGVGVEEPPPLSSSRIKLTSLPPPTLPPPPVLALPSSRPSSSSSSPSPSAKQLSQQHPPQPQPNTQHITDLLQPYLGGSYFGYEEGGMAGEEDEDSFDKSLSDILSVDLLIR